MLVALRIATVGPFFLRHFSAPLQVPSRLPAALVGGAMALITGSAHAQDAESPGCRRTHALAQSQAYILVSPRITAEAGHVPAGGTTGLGGASGYQVRGGLSWSPIDFVHGLMALDAAGTECDELAALARARRTLELGSELGELPARRAERDALVAAREQWEEIVRRTQTRVTEGLATEQHLTDVRAEVERLERRVDQVEVEVARLVAAGHDELDASTLASDLETYERRALDLERQQSSMRRLAPWNVTLLGSVVPVDQGMGAWNVDWFGWVSVSYSLGGIAQQLAEDDAVEARAAQLGADSNELRRAFDRFARLLDESIAGLQAELEHVDRQIEIQRHQRDLMEQLETSEVENLRAMIDLQVIGLTAERAHLARLLEVRSSVPRPRHPLPEGP
ncbi:MAG: hypothetical protein U0234_31605 [Sandaracinus sp.]